MFANDWWLDAVCGDNWDAIFFEPSGALAVPFKKKYGLKLIQMPMLTQGLTPAGTVSSQIIPTQLPAFDLLDLYFAPGVYNCDWKGYKASQRHTHRITDLSNTEKVFANFNSSTRQQIRKAEKKVKVFACDDIDLLYKMVSLTFKRQSRKAPYSLAYVKKINEACLKHACRRILVAKDEQENVHGACFVAWDKQTAYYVMGGSDPKFKSSAAYSLLMWEAIKEAAKHSKEFDFCGSMIPSIARFFKGFGAVEIPYYHLKKVNSKALRLFLALKKK